MNNLKIVILYGFILGLSIAILFLPYKDVQHSNGGIYINYVNPYEYIIKVLRFGIGGGLIGSVYYWFSKKKMK